MSVCSCGGITFLTKNKKPAAVLRYLRCGACGRCVGWELYVQDHKVSTGEIARRAFNDDRVIQQTIRRLSR